MLWLPCFSTCRRTQSLFQKVAFQHEHQLQTRDHPGGRCRPHYRQLWPDWLDASDLHLYSHPENEAGEKTKPEEKCVNLKAHRVTSKFSSVAGIGNNSGLTLQPFFILKFQKPLFPSTTNLCTLTDISAFS